MKEQTKEKIGEWILISMIVLFFIALIYMVGNIGTLYNLIESL